MLVLVLVLVRARSLLVSIFQQPQSLQTRSGGSAVVDGIFFLGDSVQIGVFLNAAEYLCEGPSDDDGWLNNSAFAAQSDSGNGIKCQKSGRVVGQFRIAGISYTPPYYGSWHGIVLRNSYGYFDGYPCAPCMGFNAYSHWLRHYDCSKEAVTLQHFLILRTTAWDILRYLDEVRNEVGEFKSEILRNYSRFQRAVVNALDVSCIETQLVLTTSAKCPSKFDDKRHNPSLNYMTDVHNSAVREFAFEHNLRLFDEDMLGSLYMSEHLALNETEMKEPCIDIFHYTDEFYRFYGESLLKFLISERKLGPISP